VGNSKPAPGPLIFNSNCVKDVVKTLDGSIRMYRNSKGEPKRHCIHCK
jgi:hypothetical protein